MKLRTAIILILLFTAGAIALAKFNVFGLFTHTEIERLPPEIRTVRDTMWLPREVVKWMHLQAKHDTILLFEGQVDSSAHGYRARTQQISEGDTVDVSYTSPVPLSPQGFFDITLRRAPKEVHIDSIFVDQTIIKTVYKPDIAWCIVSAAVGVAAGVVISSHSGGGH